MLATGRDLWAQEPFADPFGGSGGETVEAPTGDSTTAEAPVEQSLETESDPVVLGLRASQPSTAEDLTQAIELLVNIGRADEAGTYLQTLANANLQPAALVSLHRQFGSALFFKLIRHPQLQPAGATLGNAVLDAAYEHARSPERLQSLIAKLNDPSPEIRYAAVVDLRFAGQEAIARMIDVLADSSRESEHAGVRAGLVRLGKAGTAPLVAALDADASVRVQAMVVLGQIKAKQAVPYLLRPYLAADSGERERIAARFALQNTLGQLPTPRAAEQFLHRRASEQLQSHSPRRPNQETVTLWRWQPDQRKVAGSPVSPEQAALHTSYRLAKELHALTANRPEHQQLYLIAMLESAKSIGGLAQPLSATDPSAHAAAVAAGSQALENALEAAIRRQRIAAAVGAAEVLGEIGDEGLLRQPGGALRPLVRALKHADRRLRFAAAMSILKIDPQKPFPGSSFLAETLNYFVSSVGARRALVTHPRLEQAQTLVGLLSEFGIEGDIATTAAQTIRLVEQNSDYEFLLLSDGIDRPVNEFVLLLRRSPASAVLPIGLMSRQANFDRMQRLTSTDPLAETFPRPHNSSGMALVRQRLAERAEGYAVPFPERLRQSTAALDHLTRLAEHPLRYGFYDLYRQQPALERALLFSLQAARAARVLGLLGTPQAQQVLVTFASQSARPLADRQAAVGAFADAVQRRGLLLSRSEILLQYTRYNRSASQDRDTQRVLGSILDAIETPTKTASVEQ